MSHRVGFWIAHFNILAVCGVLLGVFGVQFGMGEMPCPLCVLQRMAMMLCTLGPAYIILQARRGDVTPADFAMGYGLSVLTAVGGMMISTRQILLHIIPGVPGFGSPVLGLHLYTWALIVFVTVLVVSGVNLVFARELHPQGLRPGLVSWVVLVLLAVVILANGVSMFALEGLHWILPDDPERYRLLDDLRLR